MIDRATKLRWRRRFRRSRRQAQDIGYEAEVRFERHFIQRLGRLGDVRRFIAAWVLLVGLLITGTVAQLRALSTYYQQLVPVAGGTYTEGIVGTFSNANPIYATGTVDSALSNLVFAGLLKHDSRNRLVGSLAEKWSVDARGSTFTVVLRPDLRWHDGHALTAEDVVFTYRTIQNPDTNSPLGSAWQGVKISAKDNRTVVFMLPAPLAAFPHSLTNGIIPQHLLKDVPKEQLRTVPFNTLKPVGSGPFAWDELEVVGNALEDREERIALKAFNGYYAGPPALSRFVVRTFRTEEKLVRALEGRELTAAAGLEAVPDSLKDNNQFYTHSIPLTAATAVFYKTTQSLLKDAAVRRALALAIDQKTIITSLPFATLPVDGPLLRSHIGFNDKLVQPATNVTAANKALDEAGWKRAEDGLRYKDKQPLSFTLVSQSTAEYRDVSSLLQKQWRAIGVDAKVVLQEEQEFGLALRSHSYDALLYSISLGTDPDMFPYWHSSQADVRIENRFNFSEYKSKQADAALEAGRSRIDRKLREVKYEPFLEVWRKDLPATMLYQPRFLYVTHGRVHNLSIISMNAGIDRFSDVHRWMIREDKVNK